MDVRAMEIVAPAGNSKALEAAIAAGADSVYLGLKGFGARRRAQNFNLEELYEYIDYAHVRGVRLFLTLNTLLKDNEIEALYPNLKSIYERGIDAFIVQDMGVKNFIKKNFPEVQIHASTQTTAKSTEDFKFLISEGFTRVVVARENSFDEIKKIKKESGAELEVFVSGAMCVSYSGKCYMSSFIGGRSGNRGLCAQPCRKIYTDLRNSGYLLSPKDQLFGKAEIEKLIEAGVDSIKIEGRMKDEKYVYETVKYYRNLVNGFNYTSKTERLFNRGYSKGYFYGENTDLINSSYSFDFGYITALPALNGNIKLLEDIVCGDGITFVDKNKNVISGSYISKIVNSSRDKVKEAKKGEEVSIGVLPKGTEEIYKNFDKKLSDEIERELYTYKKRRNIKAELTIKCGEPVLLKVSSGDISIIINGEEPEVAKKPMDKCYIENKLSEIGETEFLLESSIINYDGISFIPVSIIKELRNRALSELRSKIEFSYRRKKEGKAVLIVHGEQDSTVYQRTAALCQTKEQEEACKKAGIEKIYKKSEIAFSYGEIAREGTTAVDWTMNSFNSYVMEFYSRYRNIKIVYLSPELSIEEIGKIEGFGIEKGAVVYGKIRAMAIRGSILAGKDKIKNEEGDCFEVKSSKEHGTEIYFDKPLVADISKLKKAGVKEIRFDFTDETEIEIEKIIEEVLCGKAKINMYNYEKGVL